MVITYGVRRIRGEQVETWKGAENRVKRCQRTGPIHVNESRELTEDGEDDHEEEQQQQDVHEGGQGLEDLPKVTGETGEVRGESRVGPRSVVRTPQGNTRSWGPGSGAPDSEH